MPTDVMVTLSHSQKSRKDTLKVAAPAAVLIVAEAVIYGSRGQRPVGWSPLNTVSGQITGNRKHGTCKAMKKQHHTM